MYVCVCICICVCILYTVILLMGGLNQEKDEGCPLFTVVSSFLGCIKDKSGPFSKKSHSFLCLSSSFFLYSFLSFTASFSLFILYLYSRFFQAQKNLFGSNRNTRRRSSIFVSHTCFAPNIFLRYFLIFCNISGFSANFSSFSAIFPDFSGLFGLVTIRVVD